MQDRTIGKMPERVETKNTYYMEEPYLNVPRMSAGERGRNDTEAYKDYYCQGIQTCIYHTIYTICR